MNQSLQDIAEALRNNLASVILGKKEAISQVMIALFSGGNILIEDVPGVGKTTLAKALAKSLDAEYNRASPRTQSALLEAMTEQQATIEGVRHPLDAPFVVVATQNPIEYHGTYPLTEA